MTADVCLNDSMDLLSSANLVGDRCWFEIPQGGVCDVLHQPQECFLPSFLSSNSLPYLKASFGWLESAIDCCF